MDTKARATTNSLREVPKPILEQAKKRFWENVEIEDSCWCWKGAIMPLGYGQFHLNAVNIHTSAHRFSFLIQRGDIPKGMSIDHLCRNRKCVNPNHMEIVSSAENTRRGKGTKLSVNDVLEIRRRMAQYPCPIPALAKEFGVSRALITMILQGHRWTDVGGNVIHLPYRHQLKRMITQETEQRIRLMRLQGSTVKSISSQTCVSQSQVRRIMHRCAQ
jgi:hypothetical protein